MTAMRGARTDDLPAIEQLLVDADLISVGVTDHLPEFVVAEDANTVVGCAGLETYGASALLRSVVVRPDYRSRGLGNRLVARLLDRARRAGIRNVYLLTTTASEYFRRLGFEEVPRDQIDTAVQTSQEFSAESCATAKAMRLRRGERNDTS
jgi:amino-acid N-acetyltransferase